MTFLVIAFIAGVVIAFIFRFMKMTVPVPHDLAGLIGLIGMYIGSEIADLFVK